MNVDEVIEYLNSLNNEKYPYKEKYYEHVIASQNAPDSYYTELAKLYVNKIFEYWPKNFGSPNDSVKKQAHEYREKLQKFLENNKQYE